MNNPIDTNLADRQLVERTLSGDRKAFAEIIKSTEALVAQLVFKMVAHPGDRKDIAQDVYLKVYKNLSGFGFRSRLSTWIGQVTYNTCLNYLEKKRLVLVDNIYDDDDNEEAELDRIHSKSMVPSGNEVEKLIFDKELSGILQEEIDRLPPLYKTLVTLFHHEELSYTEIGEITSLPEGTLKNYLYRARKALKKNILSRYKREEL